jgi:hypothetical protein
MLLLSGTAYLHATQQAYKAVNQQFADAIQDIYRDGDMVRLSFCVCSCIILLPLPRSLC